MASVTSLGIHRASAIPFLVAEGILPPDPSENAYTWQTCQDSGSEDGREEEELVTTKHCVVWSRGGVIQRIFRFDVEKETITQALFTHFPTRALNKPDASPQHGRSASSKSGPNVQESKATSSGPEAGTPGGLTDGREQNRSSAEQTPSESSSGGRALVVVLKTQAQIFLLTKTSHVVHLPFEVDSVFPSAFGILLQRKMPEGSVSSSTPHIPAAPENSFALSQASSWGTGPISQKFNNLANLPVPEDQTSPFLPLLQNLAKSSSQTPEAGLPSLFCLLDPLSEVGTVVTRRTQNGQPSFKSCGHSASLFDNIDSNERLLYISPKDELAQSKSFLLTPQPLLVAVTENQERGTISVWTVTYLDHGSSEASKRQRSLNTSGTVSRRRSSYSHARVTGSATPVARGAISRRESNGITRSHRHTSKDSTFEEGISARAQVDFLDTALENPAITVKSSRRVSSLLARADLSTSHDKSTFSDLAGGHAGHKTSRKAQSVGAYNARLSTGPEAGNTFNKSNPLYGIRSSLDSVSLHEASFGEPLDELDDIHDLKSLGDPGLHDAVKGLRKEAVFHKVYSMPRDGQKLPPSLASSRSANPEVITMKVPNTNLGASDHAAIVLCLIDRSARELVTLRMKIARSKAPERANGTFVEPTAVSPGYSILTNGSRRSGVIDVCKVGDGDCCRILQLDVSASGRGDLSLQAPWAQPKHLELPSPLCLHDPYQITKDNPLRQRREGGFKRVLSQNPQALIALRNGCSQGRADVVDSNGIRHRIQMQFHPRDPLISQIIRVAEAVLPASGEEEEPILRAWWDATSWLHTRSEEEDDSEWTAMIVVLFSMCTPFIEDRRTEGVSRHKRRKGGLLRSSSGAYTDLESWEAMILQESCLSSTSPAWMHQGAWEWTEHEKVLPHISHAKRSKPSSPLIVSATAVVPLPHKSQYLLHCTSLAREFVRSSAGQAASGNHGYLPTSSSHDPDVRQTALASILVALHLLREEFKLNILAADALHRLTPILIQIGSWLGWQNWGLSKSSYYMLESTDMEGWQFDDSTITGLRTPAEPFVPPSILRFLETTHANAEAVSFVSLLDVASPSAHEVASEDPIKDTTRRLQQLTPRTALVNSLLAFHIEETMEARVAKMVSWGLSPSTVETLPESIAVSFRAAMISCQAKPSTAWNNRALNLISRDDIAMLEREKRTLRRHGRVHNAASNEASRDVHIICNSALEVEATGPYDGSAELDRQSLTRLLFKEDQRFAEAAKLVHPLLYPVARCAPEPEWSDTELLEAQQELVKIVAMRTLSVSPGRGLLFYSARLPLLTEKFPIHGFTLSCVMKPTDTTVTADRTAYTEEKVSWAFFHAGVEAGLSISKDAKGIDTSWILFNKPRDLTNRHAGFLFAMGLNGHLKSIAKWVNFKYLTPKHSMTSIGLLLGLSASYLGTMDTLITRLLSVHVTRMLPPGAAELNLSPLTQTSGIMGIGLLYCNTQHRRMSEVMLSEMENAEQEDSSNPLDSLRDEGYRLAAGFALGYINLGRGKDLKGLHDMHITERLLALVMATKRVDIVHILDRATAGATVAIALIFMKTQDEVLARKVDIPDTTQQFEYVRPDQFLLRTVARHLIMWDDIQATSAWMKNHLPFIFQQNMKMTNIHTLTSEDMPFFNIIAGLCLSIGLRYAGSEAIDVRNLLCHYLDQFMRICRLPTLNYDGKLARITVRNCQDAVALAAACVMAGTGDLHIFRRLRSLHGRTDAETPYGSHLAAHFAIGVLFLGGGTHTFGTSNIAIASLLCAFYPLFPNTVLDNKSHLQAFRHFCVLAAERRCLVARDVDTNRPISLPVLVTLRSGVELAMTAPCLLPEIEKIVKVQTNDPEYWSVTLDLTDNPSHPQAFRRHQSIYLRRRTAYDGSVFSATMHALNDAQSARQLGNQAFEWIFTLPAFSGFDRTAQALVLPADNGKAIYKGTRGTVVDDRMVLEKACIGSGKSERLWNLRILFAWADSLRIRGEEANWIGKEVVEGLRATLAMRRRPEKKR